METPRTTPRPPEIATQKGATPINPRGILRSVEQAEENRVARKTGHFPAIDELEVNQGNISFRQVGKVNEDLQKCTSAKVKIPESISDKLALLRKDKDVEFSKVEVSQLKDMAYEADQRLEFEEQRNERSGLAIEGDLKSFFKDGEQPPERKLLQYCDWLKKLFRDKRYFPDSVTEGPPQRFEFHFADNQSPTVVEVKTVADLGVLQRNLERCNKEDAVDRPKLNASDPFGYEEKKGPEKGKILENLMKFSTDKRGFFDKLWDGIWSIVGIKTENVRKLEEERIKSFETQRSEFDKNIKGDNPSNEDYETAVFKKLPRALQRKLEDGELITTTELHELKRATQQAFVRQRYIDDMRKGVSVTISDLKGPFAGKDELPKKAIIEKFLGKLRDELRQGGYPSLVTSSPDVTTFEFFINREYKLFQLNIADKRVFLSGLDELEGYLKACADEAQHMQTQGVVKAETEKLRTKVQADAARISELEAKLQSDANTIRELEEKNHGNVQKLKQQESENSKLALRAETTGSNFKDYSVKVEAEKKKLENEKKELEGAAQRAQARFEKELEELKKEKARLEQAVQEATVQEATIEGEAAVKESPNRQAKLEEEIIDLQKKLKAQEKTISDLDYKAQVSSSSLKELEKLKGENEVLKKKAEEYKKLQDDQVSVKQPEKSESEVKAEKTIIDLEKAIVGLKANLDKSKKENQSLKQAAKEYESQNETMQELLQELEKSEAKVRAQAQIIAELQSKEKSTSTSGEEKGKTKAWRQWFNR